MRTSNATSSSFVQSWKFIVETEQYMGNLKCPFEAAQWNLDSHDHPLDLETRRGCEKLRHHPFPGYIAPEPAAVFEKLPSGATINFIWDLVSLQHGVDFSCHLASIARVIRADAPRNREGGWCNESNVSGGTQRVLLESKSNTMGKA